MIYLDLFLKMFSLFLKVKPAEAEEVTGAEVEVRGRLQVDLETAELPVQQQTKNIIQF
jgi:hypothetical protein